MPTTNDEERLKAKLDALSAYVASFSEGTEAALQSLEGKVDADSIKRHLAILIDKDRYTDAANVVEGLEPDLAWVDKAVAAFAAIGQFPKAQELVEYAKQHGDTT